MTTLNYQNYVKQNTEFCFKPKDPMSALTHLIGVFLSLIGMPILLICAAQHEHSVFELSSYAIYMFTMILLYSASTSYHSFHCDTKINRILKTIDHISIFYLIAGSYTPICINLLPKPTGIYLLIGIWAIALIGTIFKLFFVYCPKWVSSIIYCLMGWVVLSVLPDLLAVIPFSGFLLLLLGGIFYTVEAILYALKLSIFHNAYFGNHELFHCFVLLGSICHYLFMFFYAI